MRKLIILLLLIVTPLTLGASYFKADIGYTSHSFLADGKQDAGGPAVTLTYLFSGKYTVGFEFTYLAHKPLYTEEPMNGVSVILLLFQWNIHIPAAKDFTPYINIGAGVMTKSLTYMSQPMGLKLGSGLLYFFDDEVGLGAGIGLYWYGVGMDEVSININASLQLKL